MTTHWKNRPLWLRCTAAALLAITAAAVRLMFLGSLEFRSTFVTFYPAVAIAALYGGITAGLLAAVLSAVLANYFWMEPVGQLAITHPADAISLLVFLASCTLISFLAEARHRAQARANKAEMRAQHADELEKVAADLRESESKYRDLVQNANSAIIRWKRDGTITYFNEFAQTFFGYNAEEVVGRNVNILVPERESTGADLTSLVEDIVSHPERYVNNINENILRDGRRVWLAWTNKPIYDPDGQVSEILAVAGDITDRKLAEEALRKNEATLRGILDATKESIWQFSPDGFVLMGNETALLRLERPPGEILGKHFFDILPRELAESRLAHLREAVESGRPVEFEDQRSGIIFRHDMYPVSDPEGHVTSVACFSRDITQSRKAEEALREQREWLRVTLSSIGDAVMTTDTTGRVTFLNPMAEVLTGWQNVEAAKQPAQSVFQIIDEITREPAEDIVNCVLREECVINLANHTTLIARNGHEIPIEDSAAPIKDDQGRIVGVVVVFHDVTAKRQAQKALQESEARFRQLLSLAPLPLCFASAEGALSYLNDRFIQVFGWTYDDIPTLEKWWQKVYPDEESRKWAVNTWETAVKKAAERGTDIEPVEYKLTCKNGSVRLIEISGITFEDNILATFIDVTERRRAEEALYRYELLAGHGRDIILFMQSNDGQILEANLAATKAYGLTREELLSMTIHQLRAPETQGLTADQMSKADDHGLLFETFHRRKDGSTFPVEVSSRGATIGETRTLISVIRDITDRKRAEEALLESEARFRVLSETAGRLLTSNDPQGMVEEICHTVMEHLDCQAFFNFLVDEKAGKLHLNACAGISREEAREIEWLDYGVAVCGCAARDALPIITENILAASDPRTDLVKSFGIQAYACHPLIAHGKVIGTLSFGTTRRARFSPQDLTFMKTVTDQVATAMERVRLIGELQESHHQLELRVQERTEDLLKANEVLREQASLLGLAHDAILVRDLDERIVFWSRGAERTYGWAQDEALEKSALDLLQTRFPTSLAEIKRHMVEEEEWEGELVQTTCDGALIVVESRQALKRNRDGKPTGALEINRDITARKQAEEKIRKSNAMLQTVFNGISDPLLMIGKDLTVRMLNEASIQYFQVPEIDKAIGKTCHELALGKCGPCDNCFIRSAVAEGRKFNFERKGLFDPERVEVVAIYPVEEKKSGFSGTILRISDVTESRNVEKQMIRADRLSSLGLLSGGIAHEIRNPLAGINLFVDLLSDEDRFKRTAQELQILDEIKTNIRKVNHIIKRILDLSKQSDSDLRKHQVRSLIDNALKLWRPRIIKDGIELKILHEEGLHAVLADQIEIEQVLSNLVQNAIEAMGGGGTLSISASNGTLSFDKKRQAVIIKVQDSGSGIPLDAQKNIFNPFFTTKYTGTGLGLAISHRIVARQGGLISFESIPEVGTTFTVELLAATDH